jgi:aminoglycoside phosphotransferase (APT) family kinase protein
LIDGALHDLAACRGRTVSPGVAGSIRQRVQELRGRVPAEAPVVGCHGDLSSGNIFVGPSAVAVIDFEGFHEGVPWEDVAYFLVHLELYFVHPRAAARLARLQDGFLRAAGAAALKALAHLRPPAWRSWPHARVLRRAALGRGVA